MPFDYILDLLDFMDGVRIIQESDYIYLNCIDLCDRLHEDVLIDYFDCWYILREDNTIYLDLGSVYQLFLNNDIPDI